MTTNKITWTHVDAHVRRHRERMGMLPIGATDAEVAYNYLKYVESKVSHLERHVEERDSIIASRDAQLKERAKVGKTKRRLDALERAVTELQSRGFGEKLIASCEQVNVQVVQEETGPFGPRDADGWYAWNGDDTMRPAGDVDYVCKGHTQGAFNTEPSENLVWDTGHGFTDIVKWRPAQ